MSFEIVTYGNPVLREKAAAIPGIDDRIRRLAGDMFGVMYASNGVGLAAPQIGISDSICVLEVGSRDDRNSAPIVMVNPAIEDSDGSASNEEGCLSVPEVFAKIARPAVVRVRFVDLNGSEQALEAEGLLARAVQHEIDHLNGVLIVDRMSVVQKAAFAGRLKKLRKSAG